LSPYQRIKIFKKRSGVFLKKMVKIGNTEKLTIDMLSGFLMQAGLSG